MGLRTFISLFFLLAASFGSALAGECAHDFHQILKSISFDEHREYHLLYSGKGELRSPWGKTERILELNRDYRKMQFEHPWEPLVPVGVGSLGEKRPDLVFVLDDICHYQLDSNRFEEEFLSTFRQKPAEKDYLHFYQSRFSIFKEGIDHWFQELMKVSPEQAPLIQKNYSKRIHQLELKFQNLHASGNVEAMKKVVEGIHSNTFGIMGELYGISAIPKVKTASTYLSQMPEVMSALHQKMEGIRHRALEDPKYLDALEKEYPYVFHSNALMNQIENNPKINLDKKLKFVERWIQGKEIDFVRDAGEKETWLELKTKTQPMTVNDFIRESKGMKSPERQIMEDREILEFLGLQDRVQLEYYVTSGIEWDLKKALQNLGVKPIEFKAAPRPGPGSTFH